MLKSEILKQFDGYKLLKEGGDVRVEVEVDNLLDTRGDYFGYELSIRVMKRREYIEGRESIIILMNIYDEQIYRELSHGKECETIDSYVRYLVEEIDVKTQHMLEGYEKRKMGCEVKNLIAKSLESYFTLEDKNIGLISKINTSEREEETFNNEIQDKKYDL